jgi:hypothetical protein
MHEHVLRIWVDPAREFVVVRSVLTRRDRPAWQVDVKHRQEDACGWVPEAVHYAAYYPNGDLQDAIQAKVKEHEVNFAADPTSFDLPFPAGTYVTDESNPKAPVDYIVREGGGRRIVQRREMGATYQQLLDTDSGFALGGRSPFPWTWASGLLALAAVMVGGVLRWRARKVKQAA